MTSIDADPGLPLAKHVGTLTRQGTCLSSKLYCKRPRFSCWIKGWQPNEHANQNAQPIPRRDALLQQKAHNAKRSQDSQQILISQPWYSLRHLLLMCACLAICGGVHLFATRKRQMGRIIGPHSLIVMCLCEFLCAWPGH